jgi:diguanylate cyclase (GGDEF)-like protein
MLARSIGKNIRVTDTFARWGGEEFVILLKETDAKTAVLLCQKLKDKIQELKHPSAGSITASFGVTEYMDGDTLESIFKRCDEALYKAKENGRNRVEYI